MKTKKALWKTLDMIFGAIVGGVIGSIIALYIETGNIGYYQLIFPVLIIVGIIAFIVYLSAKDELTN